MSHTFKKGTKLLNGYVLEKNVSFVLPELYSKELKQFQLNKKGSTLACNYFNEDLHKEFNDLVLRNSYVSESDIKESTSKLMAEESFQKTLEIQKKFLSKVSEMSLEAVQIYKAMAEHVVSCILTNSDFSSLIKAVFTSYTSTDSAKALEFYTSDLIKGAYLDRVMLIKDFLFLDSIEEVLQHIEKTFEGTIKAYKITYPDKWKADYFKVYI